MALSFLLIAMSLIGLIIGYRKKNKKIIVLAILLLVFVIVVWIIYAYLYSLTPY